MFHFLLLSLLPDLSLLFGFAFLVGSSIDNFVHSLRQQSIAVDIDVLGTRNGTEEVLYNGAITVLGDEKVC